MRTRGGLRLATVALVALVSSLPATIQPIVAQTCSVPAKTLTSDCGSTCELYEPCMLNASSSPSSISTSACSLECITVNAVNRSSYSNFTFMVQFGAGGVDADTKGVAYKKDTEISTIGKLTLPSTATEVYVMHSAGYVVTAIPARDLTLISLFYSIFRGGNSLRQSNAVRAYVVDVDFASNFLTENTQVASLVVDNINLTTTIDALVANFPARLTELYLENDLIKAFPTGIASLKALSTLYAPGEAVELQR